MPRFVLFSPSHLAALALVALAAVGFAAAARRGPLLASAARWTLSAILLVSGAGVIAVGRLAGASWLELLPLHLCDAALLVAVWALVTQRPLACELTWFWSAGSLLATITPDLGVGPPHPLFYGYFAAHGGVVVAGALVVFGLGRRPRRRAALRAFLWTNAYAAAALGANLALSANYLYLLAKPAAPSPLDWFGPWPVYLAVCELVALALFTLMALPFGKARAG